MKTILAKPTQEIIYYACELLKDGEVVAVPTETVYGLAVDCSNPNAIKKVFKVKGRPQDNPLIVHISNRKMLNGIVKIIPKYAEILIDKFWPGPLTVIMEKGEKVCFETTANMDSVGVRMPDNAIAREIIEKSGIAFAAPSANISGKPSPTDAQTVYDDMNGKIPLIVDGGTCIAGVESTVLSLIGEKPIILRPGVITKEQIERVIGVEVMLAPSIKEQAKNDEKILSPGMKYKHYAPNAELVILKGDFKKFKTYVEKEKDDSTYALCFDGEEKLLSIPSLSYGKENDSISQAHYLFYKLRKIDKLGIKKVFVRCPSAEGVGLAVYNRLIRAAGFRIIEL